MQPVRAATAAVARSKTGPVLTIYKVPKTAIHSDIRRLLASRQVEREVKVQIGYKDFLPKGEAYVTFISDHYARAAGTVLQNSQISGRTVEANTARQMDSSTGIAGTGPDANVSERGTAVLLRGIPGNMPADRLRRIIPRGIELQDGPDSIVKVELRAARTARFLIRTQSPEDAHRLVRRMHLQPYNNNTGRVPYDQRVGTFIMRAQVVY